MTIRRQGNRHDSAPAWSWEDVHIYALVDPRDGQVRYVGQSTFPARRLRQHCKLARRRLRGGSGECEAPVYGWIGELLGVGLRPELHVLEVVPGRPERPGEYGFGEAREAERRWIRKHRRRLYNSPEDLRAAARRSRQGR